MFARPVFVLSILAVLPAAPIARSAEHGDLERGARAVGTCAACHSLVPDRHMTGPSLAGVLGRAAGTAEGFRRYSPELKASGVVWDRTALDAWLADPAAFIPGNRMIFRGLPDPRARGDLIAYVAKAGQNRAEGEPEGGMGMAGAPDMPDLKTLGPEQRVTSIRHCGDTYEVATAEGSSEPFWEFNLRFKTDSSALGPEPGKPVIVGGGMMGDRASVVFASPQEISPFIAAGC